MRTHSRVGCAAGLSMLIAGTAIGATPTGRSNHESVSDYGRDVVTVITNGRQQSPPTSSCQVWANAEGLGIGPLELDGYHGISMRINLHPMPSGYGQLPTSFAVGLASLKADFPTTPKWLLRTVEKNRVAIETACADEHLSPYTVYKITKRDQIE